MWKDKKGHKHRIQDMSDQYIRNCMNTIVERDFRVYGDHHRYGLLENELKVREENERLKKINGIGCKVCGAKDGNNLTINESHDEDTWIIRYFIYCKSCKSLMLRGSRDEIVEKYTN